MLTQFHFAEDTFALHLLFQGFQRLIDVVVSNQNLHGLVPPFLGYLKIFEAVLYQPQKHLSTRWRRK